jgi:repressor LexA
VVVALLRGGEEVTVQRTYRKGEKVKLRPENGDHEELVLPAEDVRVQGCVVYVVHPPGGRGAGGGT